MIKILAITMLLGMCISVHAGGFYKWKDENGKIHITDYLPDGVEIIKDDKKTGVNKVKFNTAPIQQSNNLNNGFYRSENQNKKNKLDQEITDAKNKYDACMRDLNSRMSPKSDKSYAQHIKRKRKCEDLYKEYAYLLTLTSDNEFIDQKIEALSKIKSITPQSIDSESQYTNLPQPHVIPPPQHGVTDQYGVFYAPAGNGNFINTKTGALIIRQGGNTYLNTQTGKILSGH